MRLDLKRPLVFFDLETTGLDTSSARIVEIAILKLFPDGSQDTFLTLVDPEIPIPASATQIHGINNFDVMDKPPFREIARDVYEIIKDSDLAGYNLTNYDIPILINEFRRAGIDYSTENVNVVDVLTIFRRKERRDLSAAYRFYCHKELEDAHSALKDAQATFEILKAQTEKYDDLPQTAEDLHSFCNQRNDRFVDPDRKFYWDNGIACFNFGKYRGKPLEKIVASNPDYLQWMLNQDFSEPTRQIIRSALKGKFPVQKNESAENGD
ncbi:MAG: 3'-5' exonuclease [Calditrichaeota bacterium]|nr:3'-5' exonuclease [Calditrichota bacterium]